MWSAQLRVHRLMGPTRKKSKQETESGARQVFEEDCWHHACWHMDCLVGYVIQSFTWFLQAYIIIFILCVYRFHNRMLVLMVGLLGAFIIKTTVL